MPTAPDQTFWAFWRSTVDRYPKRASLAFVRAIYRHLRRGPAQSSPDDSPEGMCTLTAWWILYWRPEVETLISLRRRLAQNEFVEIEGRRIAALLALQELMRDPTDPWEYRYLVYSWLREMMRRGERDDDFYVSAYRIRDGRTHPAAMSGEDPYTVEILGFLVDREGRLRQGFAERLDGIVPQIVRWLLRRYEFRHASRIIRASRETARGRASDEGVGVMLRSLTRQAYLPRLWAATAVGAFASASQSTVWSFMVWLGSRPVALAVYVVTTASLAWLLMRWEVEQRARFRRDHSRAIRHVFCVGVVAAVVCAVPVSLMASIGTPCDMASECYEIGGSLWQLVRHLARHEGAAPVARLWGTKLGGCRDLVGAAFAEGATALLLGYLLQLLWEDKPISERI